MSASAEPYGTDGYYYVVQAEHLVSRGRMHVPDASWVLQLFAGASAIFEPVLAVKVASALLAAACVPAAGFAGVRLAGLSRGAPEFTSGLALAGWAAASPTLTHLAGDFPKSLGAAAPLLLLLGWGAARPKTAWGWLAGLALSLLAATAHRLGAALLGLGALGAAAGLFFRWRSQKGEPLEKPGAWKWPALFAGFALLVFVAFAWLLPNLLKAGDLARVFPQLDFAPRPPPPFPFFELRHTRFLERLELVLPWIALVFGAVWFVRRPVLRPVLGALLLPLSACLLVPWRSDVLDLGYRLALMAPLLAAPLFLVCAPPLPALRRSWLGLALLPLALCGRVGLDDSSTPPYGRYRRLLEALPPPRPRLLIAHVGMNFLYDHLTGAEAMAWAPEPELDRTQVYRLAYGVRDGEWLAYAPAQPGRPAPLRLDPDYTYVREDVWEAFTASARAAADEELLERLNDWRNPSGVRPVWMRKR